MKMHYTLYEWYDDYSENPVEMTLDIVLFEGDYWEHDGLVYEVISVYNDPEEGIGTAMLKTTMQQIDDTATQVVHKCLAKKLAMEKLSRDDFIKLEKVHNKSTVDGWKKGRVKMNAHNKTQFQCPDCKVILYKKQNRVPEQVVVEVESLKSRMRNKLIRRNT